MRRILPVFGIIVMAFLLRLLFIYLVPPAAPSFQGDDGYYQVTGVQISDFFKKSGPLLKELFSGNLFREQGTLEKYGLTLPWGALRRGPVYPAFLGVVFWLAGPNPWNAFVAQALLVSLACGFLYGIAKEAGEAAAGLISALFLAVYPPAIFVVSQLLQESLSLFLFTFTYFLIFRLKKNTSPWLFLLTGAALFLLSFSRSTLVFFPFFLAVSVLIHREAREWIGRHRGRIALLGFSFLLPYGLWAGFVSKQFHRPTLIGQPVDREMRYAFIPEYDGWNPDMLMASTSDPRILDTFPSPSPLPLGGERVIGEGGNPWRIVRLIVDRFRRLWWHPFEWPWRSFLFNPFPLHVLHHFLVLTAVGGGLLLWFQARFRAWLLTLPAVYGTLLHSFFHIEGRYALIYLPFLFIFSGFFLHRMAICRSLLFFFLFVFLEAGTFYFLPRQAWSAPLGMNQVFRQEIFMPKGSLQGAEARNLRIDLEIPRGAEDAEIWVNGASVGKVEALRQRQFDFHLNGYGDSLRNERKEAYEMRQWHSLEIPEGFLKEGEFNQVEIRPTQIAGGKLKIYGDSPRGPANEFFGPLFQHSSLETSLFKYQFDGDFRLEGRTPLRNGGVRSAFYDGHAWKSDDLTSWRGVQKGQYRIRIEIEKADRQFFIY